MVMENPILRSDDDDNESDADGTDTDDDDTLSTDAKDGDDDTQLTQTEVVDYVSGSQVNLGADSQVDGSDIVTANGFAGYLPAYF